MNRILANLDIDDVEQPRSPMRVLCAPDSFKESIAAPDAARAIAAGVRRAIPGASADICPVGDGGEGTLESLIGAMGGRILIASVVGPRGRAVNARYGIADDGVTGIVELAQASGLTLLPHSARDPTRTTTFGTGQLIRLAAEHGCDTVIVCLGGSATVDGATGIAQALGARFFDATNRLIDEPMTGGRLAMVSRIDLPDSNDLPQLRVACDVTNPLCGERGAAAVYGPQKVATPEQVVQLDQGLAHLAQLLHVRHDVPGYGAAGGAAFGLAAMLGATLDRGIDLVLDAVDFDRRCRQADLVITGEGRLDAQSLFGKASLGVAQRARRSGVPTVAIVGSIGDGAERCVNNPPEGGCLVGYESLAKRFGVERAMNETAALLEMVAAEVASHYAGAV